MATTAAPEGPRDARDRWRLLIGLGSFVVLLAAATGALALVLARFVAVDALFAWRAALLCIAGGGAVLALAAKRLGAADVGAANRVTLVRGALTMLLAALLGAGSGAAAAWVAVGVALVALALDGVDGRLARSRGESSAFGARFDMETDALLILVLAGLAWQFGKAGAWILLAGALRYLFVAAGRVLPWLGRPLPPSRRRQAVCVVQIASLIVCLAPPVGTPTSGALALAGLVALSVSFAIDAAWLARRAHD